jgi:hypothetical protein
MIYLQKFNITIGPEEGLLELAQRGTTPDIVLNVADSIPEIELMQPFKDTKFFWYPINEVSRWGYGPFFWSKRILDFYTRYSTNNKIFVHCHAGAHRSPMIVYCWLLSMGFPQGEIDHIFHNPHFSDLYAFDLQHMHIPADLGDFYAVMNDCPTYSLMGCLKELAERKGCETKDQVMQYMGAH